MNTTAPSHWIAFAGTHRIARGAPREVAAEVKGHLERHPDAALLVFDVDSSETVELDLRGSLAEVVARLPAPAEASVPAAEPSLPRPGRPKLGVVPREVTLFPRHWEWLAKQPGGASVTLRKLVEQAMRTGGDAERLRRARDAAWRFMTVMAGDEPGFEEASRALFAGDLALVTTFTAGWPADVRDHALALARRCIARPGE
jgi:hypothetical protein